MGSNFKSFSEVSNALRRASLEVQKEVRSTIEYYTHRIEYEAIQAAPGAGGMIDTEHGTEKLSDIKPDKAWTPIGQAIGYTFDSANYRGTVYVDRSAGDVAAWVEFGTGQSASNYLSSTPPEWQSLARLYYVNGKGTIIAQPYLLPAFLRNQDLCLQELRVILKNISL